MEPQGTIAFSSVGIPFYGFDVFSVALDAPEVQLKERCHTDGISANFNGQFADEGETITFVSERTGSSRIYRTGPSDTRKADPLPDIPESLFHDRPTIRNGRLYFVSAHEPHPEWFKSWAAIYSTRLDTGETTRITPPDWVDLSPAVSRSGKLVAVASHGSHPWKGDFRELLTDVVVFRPSEPACRSVVASCGGWPAWAGDSSIFFHRVAEDGWWSIYRVDLTAELEAAAEPRRVTPPGVHAFTPAASHDERRIAVATRRKGRAHRHIEIFDLVAEKFISVTELINPNLHHYNPFFSPESGHLGYHRSRGDSAEGETIVPYVRPVRSPINGLRMLRLTGTFPSYSPNGDFVAVNGDFMTTPGMWILRSDGSKRWTLLKQPGAFYTAWSPTERGVIYTSLGPIFESTKATVQIARVRFNLDDLDDDHEEVEAQVTILTRADTGNNAFPSVSPDGKWLVFRSGRSEQKNLYIVDAVTGEKEGGEGIRRLTEGDWVDTMPSWSPRRDLIAFSSNRHNPANPDVFSIYLVNSDGSGLRRVHVAGPEGSPDVDRERANHVCFSPDGNWLLFTANLGAVSAETISFPNQFQPYGDLYACRLDGTGLRRLTCNAYENGTPAWYPGGALDIGSLKLDPLMGDKLVGWFDEPLWLTCDI